MEILQSATVSDHPHGDNSLLDLSSVVFESLPNAISLLNVMVQLDL